MTDGEPEPFRMPTDPDDGDVEPTEPTQPTEDTDAADTGAEDTEDAASLLGVESIADLIDEASRTAAEQAELEAAGEVPPDRSADVWGDRAADDGDTAAVWDRAGQDGGAAVWDLDDDDGDAVWGEPADPGPAVPDEPAVPDVPDVDRAPPAAASDMEHVAHDEDEPETFTFDVGPDSHAAPAPARPATPATDEEPETFQFEAGPATSSPMPAGGQDAVEEEPETFSFAVADEAGAPPPGTGAATTADDVAEPGGATVDMPAPTADVAPDEGPEEGEWTVPGADDADGEDDHDDDVWTFDVQDLPDDEQPLAESAAPRDATGWHDRDAEQEPTWTVPGLPARAAAGDEEEPEGFAASLQEAPVESDLPPADVVAAEVHDALGDLLGNDEQEAVVATGDAGDARDDWGAPDATDSSDLDHLDGLEHLDDLTAAGAAGPAEGADGDEDVVDEEDEPAAERPLDAPTAARQVMEPGSVTFSSSGGRKKKKRGLFG